MKILHRICRRRNGAQQVHAQFGLIDVDHCEQAPGFTMEIPVQRVHQWRNLSGDRACQPGMGRKREWHLVAGERLAAWLLEIVVAQREDDRPDEIEVEARGLVDVN